MKMHAMHQQVTELKTSGLERKQTEEALRESEKIYRLISESTSDLIAVTTFSLNPKYSYISPSHSVIMGYTPQELIGKPCFQIVHPADKKRLLPLLKQYVSKKVKRSFTKKYSDSSENIEFRALDKSGNWHYLQSTVNILGNDLLFISKDITKRKEAEAKIREMAYHDALTSLPNRVLFVDRLKLAIRHAHRNRKKVAVMLLDLDYFKDINDTHGHKVGDELLRSVGKRLTNLLRKSDTVSRMGGDEFLLLLPDLTKVKDAATIAHKIIKAFQEPFAFYGNKLSITTSIGIALYPTDGEKVDILLANADIAMYQVKKKGRNNYQRYTAKMRAGLQGKRRKKSRRD